jgi:hypothetical protein
MSKVKTITKPGIYDIAEADYHADPTPAPSLSKSIAKTLLDETPRHAWMKHPRLNPEYVSENKAIFDLGSAAHKLVLGAGAGLVVVDAADWRTKIAKEQRDAIYADGKVPLLPHNMEQAQGMANAAQAQLKHHPDARDAFQGGKSEQTIAWQDDGLWCRAMLDWMPDDGGILYDYKTTGASANADEYTRQIFNLGYDLQAAHYSEGFQKIMGGVNREFRFIVQENKPPYAINVIQLQPSALDIAASRMNRAKAIFRQCLIDDRWPGYPGRVNHVEAPIWYEMRHSDTMLREKIAVENGEDLRDYFIEWQAPKTEEK